MLQSKDVQEKIEATNLELYGYKRLLSSKEHREKGKLTLIEKYGVDHIMKCEEGRKLAEETCMKKYGFNVAAKHQIIKDKIQKTNKARYNEISPLLNSEIREKTDATQLKYKDKIPNNSFKRKPYILPSGNKILVQGNEDRALDMLLRVFDESDIVYSSKEMEKIFGKLLYVYNNVEHRYFPDFYIKSANRVIEVKSKWTMESNLDVNLLKEKSCLDKGLNFKFMIID